VKVERFVSERRAGWARLEELLGRASGRPERLGPDGVRELGARYRAAAADLALARRRFPSDPVTGRLERLVASARQTVYGSVRPRASLRAFVSRGYWRRVRERPVALAVAAALLFGTAALAMLWGATDPGAAAGVVPGDFIDAAQPPRGDRGLSAGAAAQFSSAIFVNNIQVTLVAFAAGITAGIGTALSLIFNGLVLGAVLGVSIDAGTTGDVLRLIVAHGVLELSCIVVAAAAGLRMGWALVDPGARTRREALVTEARAAVVIAVGTAPWLVVAGLTEGFVSPSGQAPATVAAIGLGLGAVYWTLVVWRGRPERAGAAASVGGRTTTAPAPSP
jgi:uncharacterized membrane protein SpoIIM required for sporulation